MEIASTLNLQEVGTTSLRSKTDVELLRSYWVFKTVHYPALVNLGSRVAPWSVKHLSLARAILKKTIFATFCGGETIQDCKPAIASLSLAKIGTILDYSVEGTHDEASFDAAKNEILATISEADNCNDIPFSVFKVSGLGNHGIMRKWQTKELLSIDENASLARTETRIRQICNAALRASVRLFFDAEESHIQGYIDSLCLTMMEECNHSKPIIFNTYQLYLRNGLERLKSDADRIISQGLFFGCKLVRGAYMEKEAKFAAFDAKPDPINISKKATDAMYDQATIFCLENIDRIGFCLGTHNVSSCQLLVDELATRAIDQTHPHVWFAQLLGMSDNLSYPLAGAGYNVAKYVPYGPVQAVIPYLIRRAQENSSVQGQTSRELDLISQELKRRNISPWAYFKLG